MEALFRSPVKIVLRFPESPDESLDVAVAFAKKPQLVREALLEAIRYVQLRAADINLLRIESAFHSTLKKPWKEPKTLRPVLEACRQGKLKSRTENLFYEHGKESGVVALCVATNQDDHKLLREIDPLPDGELIELVKNVQTIPKRAAFVEFVEEFIESPRGVVSDPPARLPRPRMRRKEIPPSPTSTQPDSSNTHQHNKRKRLDSVSGAVAQGSPRAKSRLPPADDATFSTSCRPPPPPAFPLQSRFLKYADIPQQSLSGQEEEPWSAPQTTAPHMRICDPQQSQIMSFEEPWQFPQVEFTQGRPRRYDPRQQEEQWALRQTTAPDIIIGDPEQSQMMSLEEQWQFPEVEFTQGRPRRYDPGQPQWQFTGGEFTQGRPYRYNPQSLEVQDLNGFQL